MALSYAVFQFTLRVIPSLLVGPEVPVLYCSEADLTPHFQALITLRLQRRNRRELHLPTPAQGCTGKKVQAELCGTLSILGYYLGGVSVLTQCPHFYFWKGPGLLPLRT